MDRLGILGVSSDYPPARRRLFYSPRTLTRLRSKYVGYKYCQYTLLIPNATGSTPWIKMLLHTLSPSGGTY